METEYDHIFLYLKAIHNGKVGTADATFIILDDDMLALAAGTLNP